MGYGSAPSPLRRALCIVLFFYLSFLLDFTAGLYSFDVFRMIQYDKAGAPFGSQRTSVSLQAVSISADIARKMVVAPYEQVDVTLIEEANAKAGGLLILLPPRDVKLQRGVIEKWMEVEAQLNSRELRIPVYFAVVTPEIQEAMSTITSAGDEGAIVSGFLSSIYSDEYVMVASSADPSPITGVSLTNFQGWIAAGSGAREDDEEAAQTSTIALVAHYDTLGVAPELATGADANGSGVTALLELARLFSKLYSGMRTQGKYNLLLVLTGGGRLNFAGARVWADQADPRLLASIELTVCLDALAAGDKLHLHVSRPAKDPIIGQLYSNLKAAGAAEGVEVELVHKKINISDPSIAWEHEVFARKRIPAATISHFAQHSATLFSRSNVLDTTSQIDMDVFARNVKVVGEGLARYVYKLGNQSGAVLEGSHAVHADFLRSWLATVASFPRVYPYLAPASPLFGALEKALGDYAEVTRQTQPWDGEVTPAAAADADVSRPASRASSVVFYQPATASLAVHKVKPGTFDLLLTVVIAAYLGLVYVYFKGVDETMKQVQGLLTSKDKKKIR